MNATACEVERGSPQLIYMEQLHRKLKCLERGVTTPGEDSHVGGTLLATSIEADCSLGTFARLYGASMAAYVQASVHYLICFSCNFNPQRLLCKTWIAIVSFLVSMQSTNMFA